MFVWDAFWEVSTERQLVEGVVSPIPWTALNQYAYRYGITDPNEFDTFVFLIRSLDNEDRSIKQKEIKRQRDLRKTNKPKRR